MRENREEQQLCPCYSEFEEFQKFMELKDSGLMIYCHRTCSENVRPIGANVYSSRDVFILHNKKDVKITTSELTTEIEKKNISCPRCRKIFTKVQELLQKVKSIDRKAILGICDHCRIQAQTRKKLFCVCDEIVKKYISVKDTQKEDIKTNVKIWLSKIGHHLKDRISLNKPKQIMTSAYSDVQIKSDLASPASKHEPEIQQMFKSDLNLHRDLSETSLKGDYIKQAVTFAQSIEPVDTSLAHTPHEDVTINKITPVTSIVDSDINIEEKYLGVKGLPLRPSLKDAQKEKIFEDDIPSMDAKEVLKRRHDLSLKYMMKGPDVQKISKIAPWEQKEETKMSYGSTITSPKDVVRFEDQYPDYGKINKRLQRQKEVARLKDEKLKLQRSVTKLDHKPKKTHLKKSKSTLMETAENVLQSQYSFFFVKEMKKGAAKQKTVDVTSSHLIKDTQEKFHEQAEKEKKRQEEVRQRKLEQDQKKKLAREEKKLQAEEKKRQAVENQKYLEEQGKLTGDKKYTDKSLGSKTDIAEEKEKKSKKDKLKDQTFEKVGEVVSEPEIKGKISKKSEVAKKELTSKHELEIDKAVKTKSEPEEGSKIDEIMDKTKKDVKGKSEQKEKRDDEITEKEAKELKEKADKKAKEDLLLMKAIQAQKGKPKSATEDDQKSESDKKLKTKQKDIISEKSEKDSKGKSEKDYKGKSEQEDKGVKKEQEIKTDKDSERDKKLQAEKEEKEKRERNLQIEKENKERLKQVEQLKKEKEALKKQAIKDSEKPSKQIDGPSKKDKTAKKKRDSTDEINVSLTAIQKSLKKDKADMSEKKKETKEKDVKELKPKPSQTKVAKTDQATEEFKRLQAQHLKDKEEVLKKRRQQEYEAQVAKTKADAERRTKEFVELNIRDVKVQVVDSDLILRLVQIKQAAEMSACDVDTELLNDHNCHHPKGGWEFCPLCLNSELELEVLSLHNQDKPKKVITDVIVGEKILKNKRRIEKVQEEEWPAELYHKRFFVQPEPPPKGTLPIISLEDDSEHLKKQPKGPISVFTKKTVDGVEVDPGRGILHYALSDRTFIEKGWTMLPTEKVVRKMNVYRMRPAHPEFDWFEHNKKKRLMTFDTGERLAEFDDNGRGRLYYKNGRLALDYYNAEETNAQQRFVIYSSGEPDERGRTHPITILATFDYLGNGIVFDHAGKIRLKYNQTEGVVLDRGIGPVSHWKWHTLNDPPVLQQVMIDTQMSHKDPNILKLGSASEKTTRPDNEEMLAIEFDNFIKEKSKKLSQKFKPFQIKMKALKINEHFSLKVLDQATVYLIFRDGSANVKFNIGMILDHQEIVDTDTAEVGEVSNSLERFPARTDSLAALQRSVAYAQRYERQQTERERRLRPPEPCASADQLTAAASRPMRPPFRTAPSISSTSTGYCSRKPTTNLYYNTRLL